MYFSQEQIEEILDLIDFYHINFIGNNIGSSILTDKDKLFLSNYGIDFKIFPIDGTLNNAFKFGVLAESLGDSVTKNMSYNDFKTYIKRGNFIPLTKQEEYALDFVKKRAYSDIKGLGNKIGKDVHTILIEADNKKRQKYEDIIKTESIKAIEERKSLNEIVSALGHKTGDWNRDFGRISDYINHQAYEEGRATSIEDKFGKDSLVYKNVYPGACRYCIHHYLTSGIGSEPKLFKLSQLKANGTNIGRKAANWLPTLGPLHPWCRCTVTYLEEGEIWDDELKEFVMEKYIPKIHRRNKILVTVGDKKYEV